MGADTGFDQVGDVDRAESLGLDLDCVERNRQQGYEIVSRGVRLGLTREAGTL